MTKNDFLGFLHSGDFKQLFLECGWNNPTTTATYPIPVGEETYSVSEVAQKGLKIYVCKVAKMPEASVRRQIDSRLRKLSHDYFLIFVSTGEEFHHLWSVPVKSVDKRQLVTIEYLQDDQAAFLLGKVNAISFSFDEEPTIVDVVDRVNAAFLVNTTDVTKKFYQGFRKQHDQFVKGIQGIKDDPDRQWYASVMLNRLMFCYFVQKKGFLDLNENYLVDKLAWVQKTRGENKFDSFYRSFLRNLFRDGLNQPTKGRTKYFIKTYGRIPYLNGGMFAEHEIESRNRDIDIPDQVFEKLFAFFDQWHWHLDNRLTASGRDINPDVLGYIFEQYINDRAQMGAYYTKEDITEYIGRNCILPFLFQKVKLGDWAWNYLRNSGDRYIFAAVKKGVDLPLPDYIEIGVETSGPDLRKRRSRWNEKADAAYALPTEIWRETVARRQRYAEVRGKIERGEITDIHDFITYNLDIRSFAEDVLRETDDHHLVGHFYKAVREVTVLDPTCGSGAFLFAALNILEPLYEICLDRMEEFHCKNGKLFKDELAEIKDKFRSNQKYFIYKNIILRNLYGVDIMHEATEIARLRLFLKMMAVVDVDPYDENLGLDPLPDIDFNVKCGNTLVGYASEQEIQDGLVNGDMFAYVELKKRIDDEMTKASAAFDYFRREQLNLLGSHADLIKAKKEINQRLAAIRVLLDRQLYATNGGGKNYDQWHKDTQPFHWYTEFYPVMAQRGGFDVIIGNPPYVEWKEKEAPYKISSRLKCENLYGFCAERCLSLGLDGAFSFIVPVAITCSKRMGGVIDILRRKSTAIWFSSFDDRPGKLFEMIEHLRASIFIVNRMVARQQCIYSTKYNRWPTEYRSKLFSNLEYNDVTSFVNTYVIPKLSCKMEHQIFEKIKGVKETLGSAMGLDSNENNVFYRAAGGGYFSLIKIKKSETWINGQEEEVKAEKSIQVAQMYANSAFGAVISSTVFYWYYIANTDCRNLSLKFIESFPCRLHCLKERSLILEGERLFDDYEKNRVRMDTTYKSGNSVVYYEYHPKHSKLIIDKIDDLLAKHYGFTEEELDFIINYDIKYRMGDKLNVDDSQFS